MRKDLLHAILGAAAGGAATGLSSAAIRDEANTEEEREERQSRIMRDALLGAGLGGAVGFGGSYLANSSSLSPNSEGKGGSSLARTTTNVLKSPGAAAVGGGLTANRLLAKVKGGEAKFTRSQLRELSNKLPKGVMLGKKEIKGLSDKQLHAHVKGILNSKTDEGSALRKLWESQSASARKASNVEGSRLGRLATRAGKPGKVGATLGVLGTLAPYLAGTLID